MNEQLIKKLLDRKESGSFRELFVPNLERDFFSNDYLGMARDNSIPVPQKRGATGSRLLSGNSSEAEDCEQFLAEHFHAQASLVFNSGYAANLGLLSSVLQRGDSVFYDQYIHASSRDGIRLSYAESIAFKHNDCDDLIRKLGKSKSTTNYVLVESLYSMDGDFSPLKQIVDICEAHNAYLIVDEAHTGAVFGALGKGVIHKEDLTHRIFARIMTFGKGYGFHGAVILGAITLKDYLINFSRSFIYSTALPVGDYTKIKSLVGDLNIGEKQNKLEKNIALFRRLNENLSFSSDIKSPIQILEFSDISLLPKVVKKIKEKGIYTKSILPPTVPEGKSRLRICIHSYNTKEEIELISSALK
ncbi:MAG: pyridoxal phosphate-dependent aminotransferase family protein [Crocinitomicaceae bacterium]